MKLRAFDAFCAKLPGATMAIQWGDSHVHKVGGKMFALGNDAAAPAFVFKTTPLGYELLLQQGLAGRAPYLPRGGWVRVGAGTAMPDAELKDYIKQSYEIVVGSLTKAARTELGTV